VASPKSDNKRSGDEAVDADAEHDTANNKGGKSDRTRNNMEEQVMRPIRELIFKSFHEPSEGEEGIEYVLHRLQQLTRMVDRGAHTDLVVRSIGSFLSVTLPKSWLDSMCRFMVDRMQLILLKFFTFKHYCSCYFNCDVNTARIFVLQCALHRRFPLLISEGCASLARSPVFYGTKQCSLFNDNNYIGCAWQLLQTGASFKVIPLHRASPQAHHSTSTASKRRHKHKKASSGKHGGVDKEEELLQQIANENIIAPLTMDLRTLEQEIERDQSKGRLPCVVIASPTDNLQRIKAICDRHGLWLHIEGGSSSLLLAAATTLPKSTRLMMQYADSISCQPFEWYMLNNACDGDAQQKAAKSLHANRPKIMAKQKGGTKKSYCGGDVPGCSATLTFIRQDLRDTPPPVMQYSDADFVSMFPLWHILCTRSVKHIKTRVDHALNLCTRLTQQLLQHKNIFTTSLLSASLPQTVVFQIAPNLNVIDLSLCKLDLNTFHELLINRCQREVNALHMEWKLYDDDDDIDSLNLNVTPYESMQDAYYASDHDDHHPSAAAAPPQQQQQHSGHPPSSTHSQSTSSTRARHHHHDHYHHHGVNNNNNDDDVNITPYFRFEPLSYSPELIRAEYISAFIEKIVVEINILRKCLELRRSFQQYIDGDSECEFVDAIHVQTVMVGLGAFRFVPSFFKNMVESESVHILNKCLCDELNALNQHTDVTQMYKLSMDHNGIVCIVINPTTMVFEQDCCDAICAQIRECHQRMKYPSEVMEVMAQAIKSGINDATKVVQDQVNADYSVDSIVRKVPLVGSVYGWLLPNTAPVSDELHGIDQDFVPNTGVGFQIGVGMTRPRIQRQQKAHTATPPPEASPPQQSPQALAENDAVLDTNSKSDNDNENENENEMQNID